jgi:hypothetical protein
VLSESETLSTTTEPEVAVALPRELFDVELQPLSSLDFFDALSVLSETPSTLSDAAVAQPLPQVERKYRPWLTGVIVVLYAAIFLVTMGINNCPKHTFPTKACFPTVFGLFALQPTGQNSLHGPSRVT